MRGRFPTRFQLWGCSQLGRSASRLTLDNLAELPGGCPECVAWEFDPVHRERIRGHEREEKAAWVSGVLREWGSWAGWCPWMIRGRTSLVRASLHLPGSAAYPTAPVSQDAVLLATGYVDPAYRAAGLGRILIQSMAKDLLRGGGIVAIEAIGATRPRRECILPADFLLAVGFKTQRPHPVYPRMRMELSTTLTWREELETALGQLVGAISGKAAGAPVPENRATRNDPVSWARPRRAARNSLSRRKPVCASLRGRGRSAAPRRRRLRRAHHESPGRPDVGRLSRWRHSPPRSGQPASGCDAGSPRPWGDSEGRPDPCGQRSRVGSGRQSVRRSSNGCCGSPTRRSRSPPRRHPGCGRRRRPGRGTDAAGPVGERGSLDLIVLFGRWARCRLAAEQSGTLGRQWRPGGPRCVRQGRARSLSGGGVLPGRSGPGGIDHHYLAGQLGPGDADPLRARIAFGARRSPSG